MEDTFNKKLADLSEVRSREILGEFPAMGDGAKYSL